MADNLRDLPPIPDGTDPALKKALDRIREAVQVLRGNRGDPLDTAVTWRTALANGLAKIVGGGTSGGTGTIGGGGGTIAPGGSGTTAPDLTPPPTVTGLTVAAGLTNIIVQFDAPVYAQGHGNQRTDIYAVQRDPASIAPLPTFGDAALVDSVAGSSPIVAIPSNLHVEWHVWAKYVTSDGVASTAPAGGTNGVVATTGKIGNADLGALIVEAGNLADGSVSASKVAALAIDATKFANGIEPVTIVTTVPGSLITKTVFNTTDGKLYRWNGSTYVATVPAADVGSGLTAAQIASVNAASVGAGLTGSQIAASTITGSNLVAGTITTGQIAAGTITSGNIAAGTISAGNIAANTITAGQIAAGAIGAAQIAASAITAGKLLVTGKGKALNADPTMTDISAWNILTGTGVVALNTGGSPAGPNVISLTGTGTGEHMTSNTFPVQAGKTYKVSVWITSANSAGVLYLRMPTQNAAGAQIDYLVTGLSPVTTAFEGIGVPTSWTQYVGYITPSSGAITAYLEIYNNWSTGSFNCYVSDFRCEEYIGADLIVDGAITANKIAANAIAVGTAAIQNGAIVNAMIGTAAIDDAKIASVAAGKLTAGSIAVGAYIQSSGYVAGSSGWKILGDGNAEFAAGMIRGQLTAAQIGAGTIDATKLSVTSLDAITATIGTLRTASTGQRMEIQDNKIRIYDASNVLRVKIGDLT